MRKIVLIISIISISTNIILPLTIKNQTKKPIFVIANYENEKFYRVYEALIPTFLNKQPILKINNLYLKKLQIYDKNVTTYKNGKKAIKEKEKKFKDTYKNLYKKILKRKGLKLPKSLLEIYKEELSDKEYIIMNAPQNKLTFIESTNNVKSKGS